MPGPAMVSALRSVFLQMSFVAVLARIAPGAFARFNSGVVAGPKIFVKALKMISG